MRCLKVDVIYLNDKVKCVSCITYYRIGGIIVSILASSAVDHGLEPRSGQTKDYQIGICCFSAKHAALRRKRKDWSARNQMCQSGATCLTADCCFSELALSKSNWACWSRTKGTWSSGYEHSTFVEAVMAVILW